MRLISFLTMGTLASTLVACGSSSEEDAKSKDKDAGTGGASTGGKSSGGGSGGASGDSGGSGATGGSSGSAGSASDAGSDVTTSGCGLSPVASGKSQLQLQSSGEARTASLYVPASYDATKSVPLVLIFHGYLGTAAEMENATGMDALADQHGFVVAYPQGLNTSWNAGKCCGTSASVQRKDVQFVSELIDEIAAKVCVDPKRVYAGGFSNGGMFSSRLACELSNRIAAIAPVAGPLAIDGCTPGRPMPVIEFHGTSDIVVPYNGGGLGGALSVADAIKFWVANAQCTDATPANVYQQGDTKCDEYSQCSAGAAVRLCTIDGGGHQWPGGQSVGIGKISTDINASAEMVTFFLAHPMP